MQIWLLQKNCLGASPCRTIESIVTPKLYNWKGLEASLGQHSNQKNEKCSLGNLEAHLDPWKYWGERDIWFKSKVFSNPILESRGGYM